jgi:phosphatidylserine/phosphatidylglycerophosphate/cardiolipin synthase-like enzyme
VKVRVIIDATGATNGYTKHELLRAAGVPVKVENWGGKMHMKSAVIDDDVVVTGSMNWTSAGEYSNDENTIIVRSADHAAQYSRFFETIWASIPDRWLTANPDPESRDSTTSCTDRSDNDFDDLEDAEDPGCGESPPPLPALPPWRIVPKGGRITCDVGMTND